MAKALEDFDLPRVLVVSDSCVSSAHGTGTVLMRHFSTYPDQKLANAYVRQQGTPAWTGSWRFYSENARFRHGQFIFGNAIRAYNFALRQLGAKQLCFRRGIAFKPDIEQVKAFEPELIYSVAYTEAGLALVDHICQSIPKSVPVIQYFMDFHEQGVGLRRWRYLRAVVRHADEIWALTDAIVEAVKPFADRRHKRVRLQPGFHLRLPQMNRGEIRTANDPRFRCVIIGNIWLVDIVPYLRRVWPRLQGVIPNLPPIQWYCHETEASKLVHQLGVEPEIVPMRFVEGRELERVLMDSDLAIVPFNLKDAPEDPYARYSLPSRLTELAACGVPVFCIAGSTTPLARFVVSNGIGVAASGEDEVSLTEKLKVLIETPELRREIGSRARAFAERHFDLDGFQPDLYGHLSSLAGKHNVLQRNRSTPAVSVIIPTYRHRGTVLESLNSVFAQTFADYEVIVVNDGSPDDTAKVLRPLADSGKIKYIEQINKGQSAARNRGLREATGEFVAFLDDDDLWPPEKLAWQVEYLKAHPLVVAVGGTCQRFSNSGVIEEPIGYEGRITPTLVTNGSPFVSPGQTLIRTAQLSEIGGFDESLWGVDDMDLWFRMALKWQIESVPRPALIYRVHGTNTSKNRVQMYRSICQMVRKHLRMLPPVERTHISKTYYSWVHSYLGRDIAFSYGLRAIGRRPYGETNPPPWRDLLIFSKSLLSSGALLGLTLRDVTSAIGRLITKVRSQLGGIPNASAK